MSCRRRVIASAFALALMSGPALADASNLYPGVTIDQMLHVAPVHWVSVDQIEASLEGKPPMVVGFDVDDTVLFSSPCFYYGQRKYSPGSEAYLKNIEFWKEINAGCDKYSIPKEVARKLIDMHQKRGDDIYFITGRTYTDGEKLSEIIEQTFAIKSMHKVVFTAGSEEKTSFMRQHAIKIYYGDADGDMRQAKEVGARPIRVLRASNSTYKPMPKNGSFGEEVIIDSAQ
ncbi:acid phosphatase AphA [Terrarubrum flagellatum]|uniref:acid phosphatase AphA n=1 Tax=Terrirubrum flagellatum TaxID=2895980 RepID=UPI003145308F